MRLARVQGTHEIAVQSALRPGDPEAQFEAGDFHTLREWLGENVHRWGQSFEPAELLERTVGGPLDAEPYLAYLRGKLEALDAQEVVRR